MVAKERVAIFESLIGLFCVFNERPRAFQTVRFFRKKVAYELLGLDPSIFAPNILSCSGVIKL